MKTDINGLSDAISDIMNDYSTNVRETVNTEIDKAAKSLKKSISADAPVLTGTQKKSWRVTKEKLAGGDIKAIVHSTDYRKVHLLENGHVTRNGITRTKPIHYVSKNEQELVEKFPGQLANAIKAVK
mgnify:FL=1